MQAIQINQYNFLELPMQISIRTEHHEQCTPVTLFDDDLISQINSFYQDTISSSFHVSESIKSFNSLQVGNNAGKTKP